MTDVIYEVWSKKSFMKLKNTCFGIGKVLFSFVNIDEGKKEIEHIDCYLDMDDAGALAKEISLGFIQKKVDRERQKGSQYPDAVWDSGLGGVSEVKAKQQKLRNDGKALSRIFSLAPGSKCPFVFTAVVKPGHTDERGLIVPESGAKAEVTVRVPIPDEKTLRAMAFAIESAVMAYRNSEYYFHFAEEIKKAEEKQQEANARTRQPRPQEAQAAESPAAGNAAPPKNNVTQFPGDKVQQKRTYNAKSTSDTRPYQNGWVIQCVLDGNETIYLVFSKDSVSAMSAGRWEDFCRRTSSGMLKFHFEGVEVPRNDGRKQILYVSGF